MQKMTLFEQCFTIFGWVSFSVFATIMTLLFLWAIKTLWRKVFTDFSGVAYMHAFKVYITLKCTKDWDNWYGEEIGQHLKLIREHHPRLVRQILNEATGKALPSELSIISKNISRTKGVCGGSACIRNTRIPVWTVAQLADDGLSDVRIQDHYNGTITIEEIRAALIYSSLHYQTTLRDIQQNS